MTAARWPYDLIDLSRPLTIATVEALFGDLVANGDNAYFTDFAVEVASDHDTATVYSCVVRVPTTRSASFRYSSNFRRSRALKE